METMKVPRRLFTIAEVAEMLGVSKDTVYELTYRGNLRFRRQGRLKMIEDTEVDRYIKSLPQV